MEAFVSGDTGDHSARLGQRAISNMLNRKEGGSEALELSVRRQALDLTLAWQQIDKSVFAGGLYVKVEDEHQVLGRYKWVRPDFVQTILDSGSHHGTRPVIPNGLAAEADIYSPQPTANWADHPVDG